MGRTPHEIVTISSLIETESKFDKERPRRRVGDLQSSGEKIFRSELIKPQFMWRKCKIAGTV